MVDTPGLVPQGQLTDTEVMEQWVDTPVGKVRYFVGKDGKLIQDRRSSDIVTNFRLAKLELGHGQLSKQLELNTALTQQVVDILNGTKMLVAFIRFMATASKWFIAIAAGAIMAYSIIKGKPSLPAIDLFDGE
jgi:hypothetical protein